MDLILANLSRSPNLQQIIVGGHSLGAQMVNRYAEVGDVLNLRTPIMYWVANPDSFGWLSTSRPLGQGVNPSCPTYDVWRDGLTNYTNTYGAALVSSGRSNVLARYNSRNIAYARGTLDFGDEASTCAPYTTGVNRGERFFNFINQFSPSCASGASCSTVDYVYCGTCFASVWNC